jgi:predicted phosphodiesterase
MGEMMIVFVGDCHGDFREVLDVIGRYPEKEISGIFFLGDQTPERSLEIELAPLPPTLLERSWFILGNHDSDRPEFLQNHFSMWDRHLHGRVIEVEGIRIGGISGVFRHTIWHPSESPRWEDRKSYREHVFSRRGKLFENHLPLKHWTTIFPEDLKSGALAMDILLTHEAPGCHPHGFSVLDDYAKNTGAKLVIHGHHHEDYSGTITADIRVLGLGLGQCLCLDKASLIL